MGIGKFTEFTFESAVMIWFGDIGCRSGYIANISPDMTIVAERCNYSEIILIKQLLRELLIKLISWKLLTNNVKKNFKSVCKNNDKIH